MNVFHLCFSLHVIFRCYPANVIYYERWRLHKKKLFFFRNKKRSPKHYINYTELNVYFKSTEVHWVVNIIATIISGLLNQIIWTYYIMLIFTQLFLFEGHEPKTNVTFSINVTIFNPQIKWLKVNNSLLNNFAEIRNGLTGNHNNEKAF